MRVSDLIEALRVVEEQGGGDRQVLVAHQPQWPLQFDIRHVADESKSLQDAVRRVKAMWNELETGEEMTPEEHSEAMDEVIASVADEYSVDGDRLSEAMDEKEAKSDGPVYLVEGGHPEHPYAPGGVWEDEANVLS